jgi:ribA/ribD-fused uncharacterized protein
MNIYNKKWLLEAIAAGATVKYCLFWGHRERKDGQLTESCLSQWWESPFRVNGVVYPTAEHWMMAQKARLFEDEATCEAILAAPTPAHAKALGRAIHNFDTAVWDTQKFEIVVQGNYHKFSQYAGLQHFLLTTGEKVLVEASPADSIWGIGLSRDDQYATQPEHWPGENLLGFALMQVRDQLR